MNNENNEVRVSNKDEGNFALLVFVAVLTIVVCAVLIYMHNTGAIEADKAKEIALGTVIGGFLARYI